MEYYDYIIDGGTLKNIYNALKLKYCKVLILTKNTYLGDEFTKGLVYDTDLKDIKKYFNIENIKDDMGYIHPDKFKRELEDLCIKNNIKFYYCAYVGKIIDNTLEIVSKGGIKKVKYGQYFQEDNLIGNKFRAYLTKEDEYKIFTVDAEDRHSGISKILKEYPKDWTLGRMGEYTYQELNLEEYLKTPMQEGTEKSTKYNNYDFVIVGGGTAGVMCAIHLGRQGHKILIIDINNALGGSSTVGGVSTYWFGKNYDDVAEIDNLVTEICEEFNIFQKDGIWGKDDFHPDIKAYVFEKLCKESNVDIRFKSIYHSLDVEKKVVKYINESINEVKYKWIIDATGDADIIKDIGGDYIYGDKNITFWSSLAQYISPIKYKNNFSSSVYLDDFDDYTDFIYTGRRRGETFDHGTYVAMRESRHIKGKYVIELEDIISFKTYDDGFYTCYSNYDPKGKLNNKMINFGFLPSQNSVQIPLRACIPIKNGKVINNIVVLGKGISCTHDAFAPLRMQKDLMHQGTAMAMVLGEAIDLDNLDNVNMNKVKEKIKKTGDKLILEYTQYNDKCKSHWVDQLFEVEVTEFSYVHDMIINGKSKIDELVNDFENAKYEESKVFFAKLLLYNGDYRGEKVIYDYVLNNIQDELPRRNGSTTCVTLLPDHGVMPEISYAINALAYGKIKNFEFLEKIYKFLELERDYLDNEKGIYHYIENFANILLLTGDKTAEKCILNILKFQEFENAMKVENRFDLMSQRLLILMLSIYNALAKSGNKLGIEGLQSMAEIYDKTIRYSARNLLEDIK